MYFTKKYTYQEIDSFLIYFIHYALIYASMDFI